MRLLATGLSTLERPMSNYPPQEQPRRRRGGGQSALKLRLVLAVGIVLFSVVSYLSQSAINPVTGEKQRIRMSVDQEIQMGMSAVPQMAAQHQGLSNNIEKTRTVQAMGMRLVETLRQSLQRQGKQIPYPFDFHLLADDRVVNAFALPGGQVFITEALYNRMSHEGQLAGVLGHEIGHVLERHSAQRMAKGGLIQGIVGAAGVVGGDVNSANAAAMIGNMINMKYGRDDELESDRWGIALMVLSGYHPDHMVEVMDILEKASPDGAPPEFMSTHPRPANRIKHIRNIISEKFPNGLPGGLL